MRIILLVLGAVVAFTMPASVALATITSTVVDIPSGSLTQRFLLVRPATPTASIILVSGGGGQLGISNDGTMSTLESLCGPVVRNRIALAERGFAVALVDTNSAGGSYNPADITEVMRYLYRQLNVPSWVSGGSASTAAVGLTIANLPTVIPGGVLFYSPQRPQSATIARITRPALVLTHSQDSTSFHALMMNALTAATPKEGILLSGGADAGCGGFHLFNGIDSAFVSAIAGFIDKNNPIVTIVRRSGIDIDGDGRQEIVIRSADGRTQIGRLQDGAIVFTSAVDPGTSHRLVGVGDFDGNGKSDLAFQNMTQGTFGDIRIWPNFSSGGEIFWRQVKQVWDVQVVGDLDGDGFADLVWRYVVTDSPDTGVSYIWFTNGSTVTQVRKRGGAPLDWQLLGAADLNADGSADMVYLSPQGQLRILMATPNRTCANLAGGNLPAGFTPLRLADFSGNRRGDILLRNAVGTVQLLTLDATGLSLPAYTGAPDDQNASCTSSTLSVSSATLNLPATDAAWQFYANADLNGDGLDDIVWRLPNGALTVWLMNANGASPTVISNAGMAPTGFSVFQNGGPRLP